MPLHYVRNLCVALTRLQRFGPGRFRQHGVAGPVMPPGRAGRVQLPKIAMRPAERRSECSPACDTFEPKAWPYDTALPEVNEGPGSPDNVRLLLRRSQDQNPVPHTVDQDEQRLDVIA